MVRSRLIALLLAVVLLHAQLTAAFAAHYAPLAGVSGRAAGPAWSGVALRNSAAEGSGVLWRRLAQADDNAGALSRSGTDGSDPAASAVAPADESSAGKSTAVPTGETPPDGAQPAPGTVAPSTAQADTPAGSNQNGATAPPATTRALRPADERTATESTPATASSATATAAALQECRGIADDEVRSKITTITTTTLAAELARVNYPQLVDTHWGAQRVEARIDREIDDAVAAVSKDVGWIERAYSTVSRETAERFATSVAERAYNSAGFRDALTDLSQAVGGDLGARIESVASGIASPVLACVQTALQTRYGGAIAGVFARESAESAKVSTSAGTARIENADLVLDSAGSISGIVLIVTRRVIGRVVAGIGQRIAGLVASRIVSTFTGIVGLALIAKDLYDAGAGVFPIVAERMKSREAKDLIKAEIARSIGTDLTQQTTAIADETAERIFAFWLEFKQRYARLLALSERDAGFAAFLKDRRVEQLGRLGTIADLVVAQEGEPALFRRTGDGSLSRLLLDLDDNGLTIATARKSLDDALAYAGLARGRLAKVVAFDLHRAIAPADITADQLATLLDIDDALAIGRLARLDKPVRAALLEQPAATLRELARRMSETELDAFVSYQSRLSAAAAARLLRAVAEDPGVISRLADVGIREAILGSRDQLAALEMLLRSNALLSLGRIGLDFEAVSRGAVAWRVFAQRYWGALVALGVLGLIIAAWLWRLVFARPRIIVQRVSGTDKISRN